MKSHVTEYPMLGELRQALSLVLFGNPLLSPEEQLLANHHIHECEDMHRIARWLSNTPAALAKRQRAHFTLTVSSTGHVV